MVVSLPPLTTACSGELVSSRPPLSEPQILTDAGATELGELADADPGEDVPTEGEALDAGALVADADDGGLLVAAVLFDGSGVGLGVSPDEGEPVAPVAE